MNDPVTLAVVRGALEQITDEMDLHLIRAALSPIIPKPMIARTGCTMPKQARRSPRAVMACRCSWPACNGPCSG